MKKRAAGCLWVIALVAVLAGCGTDSNHPTPIPSSLPSTNLPAVPQGVSPGPGTELTTDMPTFIVQNASGYDAGQAQYNFEVVTAGQGRVVAQGTVPAGSGTTSFTPAGALPRASQLVWIATAVNATGSRVVSARVAFRSRSVDCVQGRDAYAKAVVEWAVDACSLARNRFNDPAQVLGPPNSVGNAPNYTGFMSLGEKGHVTVDMETCATDAPGNDVRVWQRTSDEPVTLYAAGRPEGPYVLLKAQVRCGPPTTPLPAGVGHRSGFCDFDLADGEMQDARYFKIEDGEIYPCAEAGTDTEGADIDAIEILHRH